MIFLDFGARSSFPCRTSLTLLSVIQFGDRCIQVKSNGIVDSGSLQGERVLYIEVTAIYRSTLQ